MTQEQPKVEYSQFESKWGFTAYFDKWSVTCSGYETESEAKAAFEHLNSYGFLR